MQGLADEARAFSAKCAETITNARQSAALQLLCGLNLEEALAGSSAVRHVTIRRLERALKVERMKGLRRHWSYDLNRHIALKQALDRFRSLA